MDNNFERELALKCINRTDLSLFLTGKAGTGKTTFLKDLVNTCEKKFVVVAPTGIAAVNAGGVTINSFFTLPPEPYLPMFPELMTGYFTKDHQKYQRFKSKIFKAIDVLVIDEVSMVRADMMDAVSDSLKKARHDTRPFGGVQVVMIGDIYQLPPVVRDAEAKYINQIYKSPFFFSSHAFRELFVSRRVVRIELQKIYRQEDPAFVEILNRFRENNLDVTTLRRVNTRVGDIDPDAVTLCTHNSQADAINTREMEALAGEVRVFDARIEGNFPTNMYPMPKSLEMKVGERVMFIKNDTSADRLYYNGSLGTIQAFDTDAGESVIRVRMEDGKEITVTRVCWANIKYRHNDQTDDIERVTDGMFEQFPIKPAWAITIHKSQGLTFDKVNIDAAKAFSFGQVYVALSRCRSLEGLRLLTPVSFSTVYTNKFVNNFVRSQMSPEETTNLICSQAGDSPAVVEENVQKARELHWLH